MLTLDLMCLLPGARMAGDSPDFASASQAERRRSRRRLLMSFEFGKGSHPLKVARLLFTGWNWISRREGVRVRVG